MEREGELNKRTMAENKDEMRAQSVESKVQSPKSWSGKENSASGYGEG